MELLLSYILHKKSHALEVPKAENNAIRLHCMWIHNVAMQNKITFTDVSQLLHVKGKKAHLCISVIKHYHKLKRSDTLREMLCKASVCETNVSQAPIKGLVLWVMVYFELFALWKSMQMVTAISNLQLGSNAKYKLSLCHWIHFSEMV